MVLSAPAGEGEPLSAASAAAALGSELDKKRFYTAKTVCSQVLTGTIRFSLRAGYGVLRRFACSVFNDIRGIGRGENCSEKETGEE